MGTLKKIIHSLLHRTEDPSDLTELMNKADAMEEELQKQSNIAEQYKKDSQRLYTEKEKQSSEIKRLEAENKQLKDQLAQSQAEKVTIQKAFESFIANSRVISERLKKVAFGKKSERFDKVIGKQTRRYVDSYFSIVDEACEKVGLPVGATGSQPATGTPFGLVGQQGCQGMQPKTSQKILNPNGQPMVGQTGGSGTPQKPGPQIVDANGQPMTGQTGSFAAQTGTAQKDSASKKKKASPRKDKSGEQQRPFQIFGANGQLLSSNVATASSQSPVLIIGSDGQPLPGQKSMANTFEQPILILGPDGQPLPGQKAARKGRKPMPRILGPDGKPLPGHSYVPEKQQPVVILGADGRPLPISTRKPKVQRKKGFLESYSTNKYVYSFVDYGRTAWDYMDHCGVLYSEQRLWLISRGCLQAADRDEELAAEKYRDMYLGYLRGRTEAYPILDFAGGRYFERICIVPEVTHDGDTLGGRHISRLFRSSAASPSVIAHLAMLKYRQGLPENAIAEMAKDEGADLDRSIISSWLIEAYQKYLWPVHWYMRQKCISRNVLLMDETYGHFLEKWEQFSCYLWGMCTSPLDKDGMMIKCYFFDQTRYGLVADFLLHGFIGMLIADGFDGYGWLNRINEDITLCSDWVHPRRKFMEVLPSKKLQEQMSEEELKEFKALTVLACISRMFALERDYAELPAEERLFLRQGEIKSCFEIVISTCKEIASGKDFDAHSELGTAVKYILDREESLGKMLEDGNVTLSTNEIERSNIIVALVRKRAFQFGSVEGAQAACGFFTFIETAEANNVDAEEFLEYMLTCLPYVLEEHENELNAFSEYLKRAQKLFEDAKEEHRKNPKADVRINWSEVGKEPSLDFLEEVMFGTEGFAAFQAMKKEKDTFLTKKLLEGLNEWEFSHSSVSREGMKMMLYSPSARENTILDGAREFLSGLPEVNAADPSQQKYYEGIIKNLLIYDCSYPRLFVLEAEGRELDIAFPDVKGGTIPVMPAAACQPQENVNNPGSCPKPDVFTKSGTPVFQGVPPSDGANIPPPASCRA